MKSPKKTVSRRKFIKKSSLLSAVPVIAAGLPASSLANVQDANKFLRLGWIGVGGRGTSLLDRALRSVSVSTLKVNAICDIDPKARARGIRMCGAMKPDGINLEVIDLRTLRPLDVTTLVESVKKTGKCLVVQEDTQAYGIGAEIASLIADSAFEYLDGPVKRLSGPEVPPMPFSPSLESEFMLNEQKIQSAINDLLDY